MELNHEEFDKAIEAMQRAVAEPAAAVQRRRLQASQSRDEKRRAVAEVFTSGLRGNHTVSLPPRRLFAGLLSSLCVPFIMPARILRACSVSIYWHAFLRYHGESNTQIQQAPVQERVFRSTRVWNLYLDLEESLGTVETAKAAYERALEVRETKAYVRLLVVAAVLVQATAAAAGGAGAAGAVACDASEKSPQKGEKNNN